MILHDLLLLQPAAAGGDITGSGGAVVGGVASSGAGQEVLQGSGAATTGGVASAGSGQEVIQGSGGATTGGVATAGSGLNIAVYGSGAAVTGGIAGAGSGEEVLQGTGGATSGGLASAGSGEEVFQGSGGATTGGVAAAGAGIFGDEFVGTGGATTGGVASSGSGVVDAIGSGGATTGGIASAGVGQFGEATTGTGGATVGGVATAGEGTHAEIFGGGGATIDGVDSAGTGQEVVVGTGGATTKVNSVGTGAEIIQGTGGGTSGGVAAGGSETTISGSGGATIGGISGSGLGCIPETIGPVYDCLFASVSAVNVELTGSVAVYTDEAAAVVAAINDLVGEATAYDCDIPVEEAQVSCCTFKEGGIPLESDVGVVGVGGATLGGLGSQGTDIPIGLLVEGDTVNQVGNNTNLASWSKGTNVVTAGQVIGESTLGILVTGTDHNTVQRTGLVLAFAEQVRSVYWKAGTATGGKITHRNITSGSAEVSLEWDNVGGVPSNFVFTTNGNPGNFGFYAVPYAPGWYRIYYYLTNYPLTSHTRQFGVQNLGLAGSTGYWALDQFESGLHPSSPVPTAGVSSASRAQDFFGYDGFSGIASNLFTFAFHAKSLQREHTHVVRGMLQLVQASPAELTRWVWLTSVPGLQSQCWSTDSGHGSSTSPSAVYDLVRLYAHTSNFSAGQNDGVRFMIRSIGDNSLPVGAHALVGEPDFTNPNRISTVVSLLSAPFILYALACYDVQMDGQDFADLALVSLTQFPATDRTVYANLTGQTIPAPMTFSRPSIALDEHFVERAADTPRWGSFPF